MFDTSLQLDLKKLTSYSLGFDIDNHINNGTTTLVALEMDYQTEETYNHIVTSFDGLLEKYNLSAHRNELLYLLMRKNEKIRIRYDAYWQNYNDDLTSREIAKFLLTFKESKPTEHLQLVIKPTLNSSSAIKDTAIAKWMCQILYDKIEAKEFPLGLFGEKLLYDLFGNEWLSNKPIDINKLRAIANKSPKLPSVRLKKLYVELCCYLQPYLIQNTALTAREGTLLTDQQANLFFEILEMIGYIDSEKIISEPKDYIHSMFSKHAKLFA